jgi:hypothetical protein
VREYLGYETHGIEHEDHVQLGTIVARTRGPLTARFHRSLHMQYAAGVGEGATGVDFKLPHGVDFRMRLSDGEIWTAHEGVNPCGLFVRRGGV